MTSDIETYMKEVVDDQIIWHDKKAIYSQKKYKNITLSMSGLSLLIPIISIFHFDLPILMIIKNVLIASISACISFLSISLNLNKHHQNWIYYRNTCEALKMEKQLFLFSVGNYEDKENKDKIFVKNTQEILAKQNSNWTTSAKVPVTNVDTNYSSTNS